MAAARPGLTAGTVQLTGTRALSGVVAVPTANLSAFSCGRYVSPSKMLTSSSVVTLYIGRWSTGSLGMSTETM